MQCQLPREQLELYLEGLLSGPRAREVETHLQSCAHCQSVEIVEPEIAALLREKLGVAQANPALRARVLDSIAARASSELHGEAVAAPVLDIREHWYRRMLASPWTPRVAMVATLLFLMGLPFHLLNQAPAMAKNALDRHECHAPSFGVEMQSCCTDLMLAVGDALQSPSEGESVPDLVVAGLELATATRCSFDNVVVNQIGYRGPDLRGVERARHRFEEYEVTIWARGGLTYFWVGPHTDPKYDTALVALMNTN
jgi:hypothetical protein